MSAAAAELPRPLHAAPNATRSLSGGHDYLRKRRHILSEFSSNLLIHIAMAGCDDSNMNVPERESLCIKLQYTQISIRESGIVQVQGHYAVAALMQIVLFIYVFSGVSKIHTDVICFYAATSHLLPFSGIRTR